MTEDEVKSLRRWYPVSIDDGDGATSVNWRYFGDHRFTEPFFEDSFAPIPSDLHAGCRTGLQALAQFDAIAHVKPSAFIFHASRSGSTLVTQLLATQPQCIVISEAPVIDDAVTLCRGDAAQGMRLLHGFVRCFGQRRFDQERHLFIKLDSWHISHLPLIRHAFPNTPLVFVYRNPHEILRSHRRQRGMQMVPGLLHPDQLGMDQQAADPVDLDGYCLNVLASFFRSAEMYARAGDLLLIHYHQLPDFVWTRFAQLFSISLSPRDIRLMRARASRHSKRPAAQFGTDENQDADQANVRPNRDLDHWYHELERYRLRQHWQ